MIKIFNPLRSRWEGPETVVTHWRERAEPGRGAVGHKVFLF